MVGLNHKRLMAKYDVYGRGTGVVGGRYNQRTCIQQNGTQNLHFEQIEMHKNKADVLVDWKIDGHAGESKEVKETKKALCKQNSLVARYVRGLRVFQDGFNTKHVDRDVNGSENIGYLWLCDNVVGRERAKTFRRSM